MGVIANKRFSTHPRALELEPHYPMQFTRGLLFLMGSNPSAWDYVLSLTDRVSRIILRTHLNIQYYHTSKYLRMKNLA